MDKPYPPADPHAPRSDAPHSGAPHSDAPHANAPNHALQFLRELVVFLAGLLLGFFWFMYYQYSGPNGEEVHIIIGLLVIILCMGRYLFLIRENR